MKTVKNILIYILIIGVSYFIFEWNPVVLYWIFGLIVLYQGTQFYERVDNALKQIEVIDCVLMNLHEQEHEHASDACDWLRGDISDKYFFKKHPGREDV